MKGYTLIKEQFVKETASMVRQYRHDKSGARVLCFENDDNNKVFCIAFRTPPTDSTGVPHILEHSTLCGSRKFPVKDPFVELCKGSLNTFLNAVTFPDKTMYPVASCNEKDFRNLMEVYMDAVFYPNVYKRKEIFMQEGWHYELEDVDAPITLNGVVYNEMKGAFSNPDNRAYSQSARGLFPDTEYANESGGDPDCIPDLTYEQFTDFHKRFYHPSNSYILLYGNMDMDERLAWMDEEYLKDFDAISTHSAIGVQKPFDAPRDKTTFYPVGKEESLDDKTFYSYNIALPPLPSGTLVLAMQILTDVLFTTPSAKVRNALVDAKIGQDVSASFDDSLIQPTLTVMVKGAKAGAMDEVKRVLHDALVEASKGIDRDALLAGINTCEFALREGDMGTFPKGLAYGVSLMSTWLYNDEDPFSRLLLEEQLKEIKELAKGRYFEELIEKYLLNNPHALYLTISPSNTMAEEADAQLTAKLEALKAGMSKEELLALIADTKALKEYQATPSTPEELATIPTLGIEDIDDYVEPLLNEVEVVDGVELVKHPYFTNGIDYQELCFSIKNVPEALIPYVGLLSVLMCKVDTANYTYETLSNAIGLKTGDIGVEVMTPDVKGGDFAPMFRVESKALTESAEDVFTLIEEIIFTSRFDDAKRVGDIVSEVKSRFKMRAVSAGHATAIARAMTYVRPASIYRDQARGLSWYRFLCSLDMANIQEINDNLVKVCHMIFRKENMVASYTGENASYTQHIGELIGKLYTDPVDKCTFSATPTVKNEGFKTASQVQYVARAGIFGEENYTGAFRVLHTALAYDYLWTQVRVLGGAYGVMCDFGRNGTAFFVSYRDPNLDKTMDVYEGIPAYVENTPFTKEELTKHIIGAIGTMDAPLTPRLKGARSFGAYMSGYTLDDLIKERSEIIHTTEADIKALVPLIKKALETGAFCVVGNENALEESKLMFGSKESI